jgi:hypothetical protein
VTVRTALLELEVDAGGFRGVYRAQNDGQTALYLAHPSEGARVVVDDRERPPDPSGRTRIALEFQAGDEVRFEVFLP